MAHRPDPDRVDTTDGFTCREVGELLKCSTERVRQLARAGIGTRQPDGTWRISQAAALAALAAQQALKGHRGINAKAFAERTENGLKAIRLIGRLYRDNEHVRTAVNSALETMLRGWLDRHRYVPPEPPETDTADTEPVEASDAE
jgi:hypothetical protein